MNIPLPDRKAWLLGGEAQCDMPASNLSRPSRLVLLGPPGVGKGTQAELLCHTLGACHLSTGDVFRTAQQLEACECSPAIANAQEQMRRGELVPDETVIEMVRERAGCLRCGSGFLLDGFPRTVGQARALDEILYSMGVPLDVVICYEMPLPAIVARLSGRRTCADCRAVYHTINRPPAIEGICDQCGGTLVQREDDRPEAIRVRMETYEAITRPLADYYAADGRLLTVSADGGPEAVLERTLALLRARHLEFSAPPLD